MNVLSLFDGMSCGQVALERAGIKYDNYFASEIDKYAIQITMKNYPNTIQLDDINNWQKWNLRKIDLLIGGSPCQGFSFAGKQLNFEDERSKLFFKFVDILQYYKPKYFLLENVKMKKEYQDVISKVLDVEPIEINSALVSAQNRKRLYWTNISNIEQLQDKGILLKDILESGVVDRNKSYCIDANYSKRTTLQDYLLKNRRQIVFKQKIKNKNSSSLIRFIKNTKAIIEKGSCLTAGMYKGMASNGSTNVLINNYWRMLTPIECERLQTLPDNYTEGVSNTQRYKCLGNGWTVDVIAHIFKNIKKENKI